MSMRKYYWIVLFLRSLVGCQSDSKDKQTLTNSTDGLTYVRIPLGEFLMGCVIGDALCGTLESPQHKVSDADINKSYAADLLGIIFFVGISLVVSWFIYSRFTAAGISSTAA